MRATGRFHVGLRRLEAEAAGESRPLWADLWYPIASSIDERPKRYLLAAGDVAQGAPLAPSLPTQLPLVVLSHGAGGSADDYPWLTETLAAQGALVLGVHHYGESRVYGMGTVDPEAPLRFWKRPQDVALAFAALLADPDVGGRIDRARVFGVGHSAGAHTILAAAGVPYEPRRMVSYCAGAQAAEDRGCAYAEEYSVEPPAQGSLPVGSPAIVLRGAMLLDPALAPSFAPEALREVSWPVWIVASRPGDFVPFEAHAGYLESNLAQAHLLALDAGQGHFVFLGECDLGIAVYGIALCKDAVGVSRRGVHQRVARLAVGFVSGGRE